jgi:long-chain acyl-CoA synthetase
MRSELLDRFRHLVDAGPDRPAVISLATAQVTTRAALADMAASFSRAFASLRLPPHAPIVTAVGNRPEHIAAVVACLESGRPLLPADPGTGTSAALALARTWGAAAVVAPSATGVPPATHALTADLCLWQLPPSGRCFDAAVMKLTSGSTGTPKAVLTSAANLEADVDHIVRAMDIRPGDTQIGYIPLSHAYGLGNLVLPVLWQGSVAAIREAFTPQLLPQDVAATGARTMPAVPFMFHKLLEVLPEGAFPSRLELLISAGAPLGYDSLAGFHRRFGRKIHSFYGTSETGGICYDASNGLPDEVTVGAPMPGVTMTLLDVEGLPAHEGRRIHVAGEAVSGAYATPDGSMLDGFDAGGFLTGDLGRLDADGNLVLTGRLSSFVNVAGRKVQPEEVAHRLRDMPELADAYVLGVPCPLRGERLVAVVVPRGARPSVLRLRQFCAAALPAYKVPRDFVVAPAIPRDVRGKVDRPRLRELATGAVTTDE